jgi:N-methylhydantoinase A
LAAGTSVEGPAVIELAESTLLVPEGWAGEVDDTGTIHLRTESAG